MLYKNKLKGAHIKYITNIYFAHVYNLMLQMFSVLYDTYTIINKILSFLLRIINFLKSVLPIKYLYVKR